MNNNDPFKKMDLNFDPTQEANVKPQEEKPVYQGNDIAFDTTTPGQHEPVQHRPHVQPTAPQQEQLKFVDRSVVENVVQEKTKEQNLSAIESQIYSDILSDVAVQRAASSIIHENTTGVPTKQDLEKTIEFIVQAEKADGEEIQKIKAERKKKADAAKKTKATALSWLFIMALSILFGFWAIFTFGNNVMDFVSNLTAKAGENQDSWWTSTKEFFSAFLTSFEAFLFIFFISYSLKRYSHFMKPYKVWWMETEPLRIAAAYKEEVNKHNELLERMTIFQLTWTPPKRDKLEGTTTLKEKLENIQHDNSILLKTIKNHEAETAARAKAQAQAAKKR